MLETLRLLQPLGWEDSLEEGMATHSSIFAWRIPWTEEPGGLQSVMSQSRTRLKWLSTAPHVKMLVPPGIKSWRDAGVAFQVLGLWFSGLFFFSLWGEWGLWIHVREAGVIRAKETRLGLQLLHSSPLLLTTKVLWSSPTLRKSNTHQISSMETNKLEGDFSHYRKIVNFSKGFATGFL